MARSICSARAGELIFRGTPECRRRLSETPLFSAHNYAIILILLRARAQKEFQELQPADTLARAD